MGCWEIDEGNQDLLKLPWTRSTCDWFGWLWLSSISWFLDVRAVVLGWCVGGGGVVARGCWFSSTAVLMS